MYGANGHTGRFVVDELVRRGLTPVLAGRSAERLARVGGPDLERRVLGLDDPELLRRSVEDVAAVINCAGPFLDTAEPLALAAVAGGAHYLDVTAEQPAVEMLYRELDGPAREAGVAVVPAMAFYGGLADLLVTTALAEAPSHAQPGADEVDVAIALDHWWPTAGTRATRARNTAPRQVIRAGRLAPLADPAPVEVWAFDAPFGEREVVQLPFSEVITIDRHLAVGELRSWLTTGALADLRDPATPAPTAEDDYGRSGQRFVVDVAVRRGSWQRRLSASGRDIYAVTAPLLVEGVARLLEGRGLAAGAVAPGQAWEAGAVLEALAEHPQGIELSQRTSVSL
ncbi:saccharopine dehydrogenase NADP-binding domain-containing protein [Myroides odoratimimus subsp. xuanwuensis]